MFEKEAEDNKPPYAFCALDTKCELWKDGFQKGAEFGYNKGFEFGVKSNEKVNQIVDNEWHYVKDVNCYEDLHFPPEEEEKGRVLIWKVQVITEKGVRLPVCYHCGSYDDLWYEINAYHVIAWKEIVPPKESE